MGSQKTTASGGFYAVWYFVFGILIVVIRQFFDADIAIYAESMTSQNFSFYYLREPIVWLGHRVLYNLFNSQLTVFFISDAVLGFLSLAALRANRVPKYLYFSFLIFFPVILGMQNIYRQHYATILVLLSFGLLQQKNKSKSIIAIILAFFSHNSAGIFFTHFTRLFSSGPGKIIIWVLFCGVIAFGVLWGGAGKSSLATGRPMHWIYIALLSSGILFMAILDKFRFDSGKFDDYLYMASIIFASIIASLFLTSAAAERLSLSGLIIFYVLISLRIEQIKGSVSVFFRLLLIWLGFLPILLFDTIVFLLSF